MSKILVTVDEQNLHITDSPKIAAQGVNENYIEFTFDSTWTGFAKVALFYREEDEDTVYQSLVDTNGLALIPHEVTDQDGKICFGVAGVKDDKIFTTEILTYKIVKGLYVSGEGTTPPTPGIYEQMLALAQALTENQEEFETEITERVDNVVANYNVEYGSTTLWTGSKSGGNAYGYLSQVADAFDFLDIYVVFNGETYIKTLKPVFIDDGVYTPNFYATLAVSDLEDNGSGVFSVLKVGKVRLNFTKPAVGDLHEFRITQHDVWTWDGDASNDASVQRVSANDSTFYVAKIVGRKVTENTEVTDIRIGADGTVFQSAGTAVRSQIEAVSAGGSGLTPEIKTALLNLLSHVAYDDVDGETYYDALAAALNNVSVVYITAAFDQGANVIYDTDSLDTLEQYLTVTAHYSDGTSGVITGYTLSGTLTVGTSTITASYDLNSTMFTVTVTSSKIYSLENHVMTVDDFINTGVKFIGTDMDFTIAYDVELTQKNNDYKLLFVFENQSPWRGITIGVSNGKLNLKYINTTSVISSSPSSVTRLRIVVIHKKGSGNVKAYYRLGSAASTSNLTVSNAFVALDDNSLGIGKHNTNTWAGTVNKLYCYQIALTQAQAESFIVGE